MKYLRLGVALLVGCGLLSGCASNASTALSVNGLSVTQSQVDRAVNGCSKVFNTPESDIRPDALNNLLVGKLGESIVQVNDLTITEGERRNFLQGSAQGKRMLSDPECAKLADGLAIYLLSVDLLGQDVVNQEIEKADIVVNPRYGRWDPTKGSILGSGSLSELDPTVREVAPQ